MDHRRKRAGAGTGAVGAVRDSFEHVVASVGNDIGILIAFNINYDKDVFVPL